MMLEMDYRVDGEFVLERLVCWLFYFFFNDTATTEIYTE